MTNQQTSAPVRDSELACYPHILNHCPRLTQTSKAFQHAINLNRSIWVHILRELTHYECPAPHSLPIVSADVDSLRAMATKPQRLLFAIKRRRSRETKKVLPECSLPSRTLSYKSDDTLKTPFQFHQMLPGGRWLITGNSASDDSVGQICCWDLHELARPPAVHSLRHPLAIFDGFEGAKSAVICQASPEDQTVVIMVRTCSADGE